MDELIYEKAYGTLLIVSVRPCKFGWSDMLQEMDYQFIVNVDLYNSVTWWPAKTVQEAIGTANAWYAHHMHFDIQPSERKRKATD